MMMAENLGHDGSRNRWVFWLNKESFTHSSRNPKGVNRSTKVSIHEEHNGTKGVARC